MLVCSEACTEAVMIVVEKSESQWLRGMDNPVRGKEFRGKNKRGDMCGGLIHKYVELGVLACLWGKRKCVRAQR